jgi:hypothetical protein
MDRTHTPAPESVPGSKDGSGAGDHDEPYQFGRRPRAAAPWPFTERQYAHLLLLRGRVQDAAFGPDDCQDAHPIAFLEDGLWLASANDLLPQQRAA